MWIYYPETATAFASLSRGSERPILVVDGKYRPSDEQGAMFSEALNVHEQAGLTPAQLRSRVAELEGALTRAVSFIRDAPVYSGNCCCGDAMEGHADPFQCGHSPVDMWDDASGSLLKEIAPIAGLVYP